MIKILSFSLPKELANKLDKYCKNTYRKRSNVITLALREFLEKNER